MHLIFPTEQNSGGMIRKRIQVWRIAEQLCFAIVQPIFDA